MRAVIFDLWDTLVEWPPDEAARLRERMAALVGVAEEEFAGALARDVPRLADRARSPTRIAALGVPDDERRGRRSRSAMSSPAERCCARGLARRGVLAKLRGRGVKLAVLSVCSEEVPAAWPQTELAGLFDAETFSSECGLMKPEPEIYLRTARALEVEPAECFFVGDGANDELDGARRVGMTPVLFLPDGASSPWPEVRGWEGLRVRSIEEVLELC